MKPNQSAIVPDQIGQHYPYPYWKGRGATVRNIVISYLRGPFFVWNGLIGRRFPKGDERLVELINHQVCEADRGEALMFVGAQA